MLHIALQVNNKEQLDELKNLMNTIGISDFENFDKTKPGLYLMSVNPIITKTLDDFSDSEIKEAFLERGL